MVLYFSAPTEEAMLERALAMSMETGEDEPMIVQEGSGSLVTGAATGAATAAAAAAASQMDFNNMTEEEQIAFAMQMSMQDSAAEEKASSSSAKPKEEAMEVEEDYSEVMNDPEFIQSVLENLPGVDPQSDAVRQAVGLVSKDSKDKDQKNEKDKCNKK